LLKFGSEAGEPAIQLDASKLSQPLQAALTRVVNSRQKTGVRQFSPEHLLLEALRDKTLSRQMEPVLRANRIPRNLLETELKESVQRQDAQKRISSATGEGELPEGSPEFKPVFEALESQLSATGANQVDGAGFLAALIAAQGTSVNQMIARVARRPELAGLQPNSPSDSQDEPLLPKISRDLTYEAQEGQQKPVIGRDAELQELMESLSRKDKGFPVLVGEAGVGKTQLVRKLAGKLSTGDVPEALLARDETGEIERLPSGRPLGKRLLELDFDRLVAFSEGNPAKLKGLIDVLTQELRQQKEQVLVFFDEIHRMMQIPAVGDQLKPALGDGDIRGIGATTQDEYRMIEKDSALSRRFEPVRVDEPSPEDAITMLRGRVEGIEQDYRLEIEDEAVEKAVHAGKRYFPDRRLPDVAESVLQKTAARVRTALDLQATGAVLIKQGQLRLLKTDLDQGLARRLTQQQQRAQKAEHKLKEHIDEAAEQLSRRLTQQPANALPDEFLNQELTQTALATLLQNEALGRKAQDSSETARRDYLWRQLPPRQAQDLRGLSGDVTSLQSSIADTRRQIRLKEEEAARLDDQIRAARPRHDNTVTAADIEETVSLSTGIPLGQISETENERLLRMDEFLRKRVIGQNMAVHAVINAVRRNQVGLGPANRPVASFLFLGPTGVGKTELAKALAEFRTGSEENVIRLDMSEYMERHSVSKLIGSPPGYVGYDEGGQLTERVRRQPYSVILFDEMEKAHPDVLNALLQILDDGRLTDAQGRTVSFKDSIIIMTSNLASRQIQDYVSQHGGTENLAPGTRAYTRLNGDLQRITTQVLRQTNLRPEFINRIDSVTPFMPLSKPEIDQILDIKLRGLNKALSANGKNIHLLLDEKARDYILDIGYDPAFGARPLGRALQTAVEPVLAKALLNGEIPAGSEVTLTLQEHPQRQIKIRSIQAKAEDPAV
jgi:ATP-dependent Clp protease ATP-binding subunit ClpB